MASPALHDFTTTFILSSTPSTQQTLFEIPKSLNFDPARQRRAHQKSRTGCDACWRRRVKCNGGSPCATCARRGEKCERRIREKKPVMTPETASVPTAISSPELLQHDTTANTTVNLQHLKLFHHFQTHTRHTLMFAPEVWDRATDLCFKFDFLMNSILCIAARHLAYLSPDDATYSAAAASHLSSALTGLRLELSNDLTSTDLDVFIATSVLLQFEMWVNCDSFRTAHNESSASFDPSRDPIFTFTSSLKKVFLTGFPKDAIQSSRYIPYIQKSPMEALLAAAQISDETLAKFQDHFSYHHTLSLDLLEFPLPYIRGTGTKLLEALQQHTPLEDEAADEVKDGYLPVIARLCLILSFLDEASPPNFICTDPSLLPKVAQYMFSFPVMCRGPFTAMVHRNDPHALILLYHFYRAVRILLHEDQYWWAHKRAKMLESLLKDRVTIECEKQNHGG